MMRVLLDTNSFLWFIVGSNRLSIDAKNIINDLENQLFLSSASLWEIAIKVTLGKLELLLPFEQLIPRELKENNIDILPIELPHLIKLIDLPFYHRDPFDRLILSQALEEDLLLISPDVHFSQYSVKLFW
ncbi:MAG: type II toxin-antitoxin system VapC family toxin [Thermodesulfobacteriota bacterium]